MLHHAAAVDIELGRMLRRKLIVTWAEVGIDVHARRSVPSEERFGLLIGPSDEVDRSIEEFIVNRFHPFAVERSRVFDALLADFAETFIHRRIIDIGRDAIKNPSRSISFIESFVLGPVPKLGSSSVLR